MDDVYCWSLNFLMVKEKKIIIYFFVGISIYVIIKFLLVNYKIRSSGHKLLYIYELLKVILAVNWRKTVKCKYKEVVY